MNITFLKTGAATSSPLAFCRCDFCNKARKLGGKDFRKRSSIIINTDFLIDFSPDVLSASFMYGKSIADIRYCLQTHSHSDHFDPSHFTTRIPEYMGVNTPALQLYGSEATLKKIKIPENLIVSVFQVADKKGIPFVLVLGPDEVGAGSVTIKNMSSGAQTTTKNEGIVNYLLD